MKTEDKTMWFWLILIGGMYIAASVIALITLLRDIWRHA